MCGVIGSHWQSPPSNYQKRVHDSIAMLSHRGPDYSDQEYLNCSKGVVALGHTRLSIIDLTSGGHQPMKSTDGRFTIVFNGEIYNYKELRSDLKLFDITFFTDSDTEVLLAAWAVWGKECLPKLIGMFAFVVWDEKLETLTCVRDAFGIKPFFYHRSNDSFSFASELPALLNIMSASSCINLQRAYDFLYYGSYDIGPETFIKDVNQLQPGHFLTYSISDQSCFQTQRWWYPKITLNSGLSFSEAASKLRSMFLENIRLHLRSDVPLGAALSGGIDSAAVVCAIRHLEPDIPINTFSFIAQDSKISEEHWVDIINNHISAIGNKITVNPEELAQDIDDMILAQGEPFGSTSIYAQYRVFKLAKEKGVTVTLDGQGADELLAGYFGYPDKRILSLLDHSKLIEPLSFFWNWGKWPNRSRLKLAILLVSKLIPDSLRPFAHFITGTYPSPKWLDTSYLKANGVKLIRPSHNWENDSKYRRLASYLRHGLTGKGLASLLRHGDRNAMRWSIESRVPFLTTEMAEFLLSLPEHYLISNDGETKHIFRSAMRGIVPDEILDRRDKIGFETPEKDWLKALGSRVFEWIDGADSIPFLNTYETKSEVKAIIDGEKKFSWQAWQLICFCRWKQIILGD